MTEKEIAELRRRFRADKSNITHVRGCYVNENREIISEFDESIAMMGQEESEKLLTNLRRTLSGTVGKNLLDIEFDTRQVAEGEAHRLLMDLRNSQLADQNAVERFFQKAIQTLELEGNYLILLAFDAYDVPYRSRDGMRQDDASSEVFSYILCSICPVKLSKEALGFAVRENRFQNLNPDWVVAAPETGFLFPAFDERSTNLYNALYYTKNLQENQEQFVQEIFSSPVPMPSARQRESFQSILGESLSEDCQYQVVQTIQDCFRGMIEEHKASKIEEPLVVSKETVRQVLRHSGVAEERVEQFGEQYDAVFGEDAQLSPGNLVDTKQLEVKTPDVTIRVNPDRGDLVETRLIDGTRYILIRAEEGVEVNGISLHL
jgi:hypothetical protein